MTSYFDITPVNAETVTLGKDGKARYVFTVTSRADMTVQSIVQAVPLTTQDLPPGSTDTLGAVDNKWLQVEVEGADKPADKPDTGKPKQLEFRPKETRKIAVQVAAAGAKEGTYRFKLVCALAEDPGAHSSSSSSVGFTVPKIEPNGGLKWWVWLLIGLGGLLLIGGIITLIIVLTRDKFETPPNVKVPSVVDQTYEKAVIALNAAKLEGMRGTVAASAEKPSGTVLAQEPKADESVPSGSTVLLTVVGDLIDVPDVTNRIVSEADAILVGRNLTHEVTAQKVTGKPVNTVLEQDPKAGAGAKLPPGGVVKLTIESQGVTVPEVEKLTLSAAAEKLQRAHLRLGTVNKSYSGTETADTVKLQAVKAGTRVDAGTAVDVTIWTRTGIVRPKGLRYDQLPKIVPRLVPLQPGR